MKCPVCRNELKLRDFTIGKDSCVNRYYCEHCKCEYEDRPDGDKRAWWKCTKLPAVIVKDSDVEYKLYEIESVCTGEVVNEYPLSEFHNQQERFASMSSSYSDGEGYELVIARADEFDEDGDPTFETDERVLCHQGDCGEHFHKEAAANVTRWRDILGL